jgi:putative ABC transport system permease protein
MPGLTNLRIAWRNLGRNHRRTALALTAIIVAQLALLFSDGLMHGYADAMIDAVTGPMLGHVQVHEPGWRDEHAMDLTLGDVDAKVAAVRRVPGVGRASARIYAPALAALGEEGHVVVVIGIEPAVEARADGLLSGVAKDRLPRDNDVLVGAGLADEMGVHAGDEIAIVGQAADGSIANDLYRVGALLTSPVDQVQRHGVLMSLAAAQQLFAMPDEAHEITVRGSDPQQAEALAATLSQLPDLAHTEVLPWEKLVPELVTLVRLTERSSLIVLVLVFIAAAAGIANTMLMATFERTREIGMLLALGTTPRRIVSMVLAEATALGLAGAALGTVLGIGLVVATAHSGIDLTTLGNEAARDVSFQGLNYQFSIVPRLTLLDVVEGVAGVGVVSVLASLWPAVHVARLSPMEAMRT